ncbi:hypothetical protein [Sphingomonas sp. 10B4]|uniref:hypothetical protein n=1 Tax=Sphingomonas sp. 10B4 TaxID=3048575 RepID=UPI002AB36CFC|nr:hypothetical protein [Sphingomonas sp. 10B4]MDY7525855.1 hypothetical protein [Sphingomonas sp. 10B4]MEB0284546.1 hypothetical protein [Sphingomonas sp. 10B4]
MSWAHGIDASWYPLIYGLLALYCTSKITSALRGVKYQIRLLDERLKTVEYDLKVYAQAIDHGLAPLHSIEENTRAAIPSLGSGL